MMQFMQFQVKSTLPFAVGQACPQDEGVLRSDAVVEDRAHRHPPARAGLTRHVHSVPPPPLTQKTLTLPELLSSVGVVVAVGREPAPGNRGGPVEHAADFWR